MQGQIYGEISYFFNIMCNEWQDGFAAGNCQWIKCVKIHVKLYFSLKRVQMRLLPQRKPQYILSTPILYLTAGLDCGSQLTDQRRILLILQCRGVNLHHDQLSQETHNAPPTYQLRMANNWLTIACVYFPTITMKSMLNTCLSLKTHKKTFVFLLSQQQILR